MAKRNRKLPSLRTQITLSSALPVFLLIAVIITLANIFINKEFENYARSRQEKKTGDIAASITQQYNRSDSTWNTDYIHGVGMSALYDGYMIHLTDADGNVIWDAQNHDMSTCNQIMMDIITRMDKKRPKLAGRITTQNFSLEQQSQKIGILSVQYYGPYFLSESEFNFLDSLNLILTVSGILALLCALLLGALRAKQAAAPVAGIAQIAGQIAEGNYKTRFQGKSRTRELNELVTAVNHMAASLDHQETLRRRLTTDVAHELRTPLTAAASYLEAMTEGIWEITPQRLQSCRDEIDRISGLVADLAELSKFEDEDLRLKKSSVDLIELAKTAADIFAPEGQKKDLTISVSGSAVRISADKARISQVLVNLISNAVKYTPAGGSINIAAKNEGNSAVLSVADDGIGIAPDELPLIFERFYRTDKSRSRSTGGAGIGLTIADSIVKAHGGTLTAVSHPGEGSCFTMTLPNPARK